MKPNCILTLLLCFSGIAFITACQQADSSSVPADSTPLDQQKLASGFHALQTSCFSCHSPDASLENRIAPPMAAIKSNYITESSTYEDFRDCLIDFVNDPSAANAQMPEAIRKFGMMPKLSLDPAATEQIAYYIYHNELGAPDWFEQHYEEQRAKYPRTGSAGLTTDEEYLRHGRDIAMSTKSVLGANLKQAINSGGTITAINFCNENAVPIADRMSRELNASIMRVSDRPRAPRNAANERELQYIRASHAALSRGEHPKPSINEIDGRMVGYYPIVTNSMCLQCHGAVGKDIESDALRILDTKYPDDQARGYGVDELRGIFVVSMEKN